MIKRTFTALTAAGALLALTAAPAGAQQDVCVTYDFAGSELCVLRDSGAAPIVDTLLRTDVCITYDFAGSELCVIRDTIGPIGR